MDNVHDSKTMIIFRYPKNSGGKFLINSIGLSNGSLLQSYEFLKLQVQGKLTSADKFEFIMKKLDEVTNDWTDLHMGCHLTFGLPGNHQFLVCNHNLNKEVIDAFDNNFYFFIIAHDNEEIMKLNNQWTNALEIQFKVSTDFADYVNRPFQPNNETAIVTNREVVYTWNSLWYTDKDQTIHHIGEIYDKLNLNDFNNVKGYLSIYYDKWIEVLKRINKK